MFNKYTRNKSKITNSNPLEDLISGEVQLSGSCMILFYVLACGELKAILWNLLYVDTYPICEGLALLTISLSRYFQNNLPYRQAEGFFKF